MAVDEFSKLAFGGPMFVDTFAQVKVTATPIRALARAYAEWMLGHTNERHRNDRLKLGVPLRWTPEMVMSGEAISDTPTLRADMRLNDQEMVARFVHRDPNDGAVLWHAVAKAWTDEEGLLLQHAVGRDAPRDLDLEPVASVPRIITSLLDTPGIDVYPRDLRLGLVVLNEKVKEYVDHVLLSPDRDVPTVVISCDHGGAPPLVNPERIARALRGLVSVVYLPDTSATFAFTEALHTRGFGAEFRCFNGAVHTYGPVSNLRNDHRIWLGDSLARISPHDRDNQVAGLLARRMAVDALPPRFFHVVEDHDRRQRLAAAEQVSRQQSVISGSDGNPALEAMSRQYEALRTQLEKVLADERQVSEWYHQAELDKKESERKREHAEAVLEQERLVSASLRDALSEAKVRNDGHSDECARTALESLLGGEMTVSDVLRAAAIAFSDRLCVLESAFTSAERASGFKHTQELGRLLHILGKRYWEDLCGGLGDSTAKRWFGSKYAATESETTKSNEIAIQQRTFYYGKRKIVMWPHLRVGNKESTAETIRVHFEWIAEERKIVIGWCGEHRYRVD